MTAKIRSIFLPVLLSLAILSMLTVSLTLGRYAQETESEGIYSGDLNYIVSNQVEIESVDEFFMAIENGYNNIKIKDDVDNPLIISGGISDVNSDLVIDLNGHEIQRNNREPLLNVTQGVKLTIIDTSEKQTGSFYNPVGSVLRISGGSLTVSAGEFESGPRSGEEGAALSEYYGSGENGKDTQQGARIDASRTDVTFFESDTDTGTAGRMPVIYPSVVTSSAGENAKRSVNGNIYFGTDYGAAGLTRPVSADTYLYFTVDDPTVEKSTLAAPGSADYFYTYYLDKSLTVYRGTDASEADDILITVYVYNDVKGSAQSSDFSAIGMEKGNLYVRGGVYRSYFGVDKTYCVNASGGYMAIETGKFYAYGRGVCVQCDYAADVNIEEQYLRVSSGDFYSEAGDTIGVSGGRMVVSAASFTKNAVDFGLSSQERNVNGSAIRVSGGSLTVSAASEIHFSLYGSGMSGITAQGSNSVVNVRNVKMDFYSEMRGIEGQEDPRVAAGISFNTGIYASGGEVFCDGDTSFNVLGSYSAGIYSEGGAISINGNEFVCSVTMAEDGADDKILSSTAISTVGGSVAFNVKKATVTSNALGITVGGGNISFSHANAETINITTTRGSAIYVYDGKIDIDEKSTVNIVSKIDPSCSWAVDTSGGSTGITNTDVNINNGLYVNGGSFKSDGNIFITHTGINNNEGTAGKNDSKIKSYAVRVDGQLSSGTSTFDAEYLNISVLNNGGGLYVNQGTITLDTAEIDAQGFGIAMRGESGDNVTINTKLALTSYKTTGIYITGGSLTLNGDTLVNSTIDGTYTFCGENNLPKDSFDGVFVEGGSLYANGTFNVTHSGIENLSDTGSATYEIVGQQIRSYAVRVTEASDQQPKVDILKGNIVNSVGGGVYVAGGSVSLGNLSNTVEDDLKVETTGKTLFTTSYTDVGASTWAYRLNKTGGHAIEVQGGSLTVNSGTYTAMQGNGILVRNTESSAVSNHVEINGGFFYGYNTGYDLPPYERMVGPGASAGLYVMGHSLTVEINGGTFGNKGDVSNSAAVFFGTPGEKRAQVNIYGGNFYGSKSDVMSVFRFVDFVFDAKDPVNAGIIVDNDRGISTDKSSAALSVQDDLIYTYYDERGSTISIGNGTFNGTGYGIYYGSNVDTLKISGGKFIGTGSDSSGLNFAYSPGTYPRTVYLSGGSYTGKKGAVDGSYNEYYILDSGYKFTKNGNTWTVVPN